MLNLKKLQIQIKIQIHMDTQLPKRNYLLLTNTDNALVGIQLKNDGK